ncbi:hypothetical protein MSIMFI_05620 [Mycobacterium simulans]|nr:hypothetical protein MSIMFI_05620 [Mycobacterium simulans]
MPGCLRPSTTPPKAPLGIAACAPSPRDRGAGDAYAGTDNASVLNPINSPAQALWAAVDWSARTNRVRKILKLKVAGPGSDSVCS